MPMTAEKARRFGKSLASQTGRKGVVSANDGRTSKTVWQVFGESNWREGGSDGRTEQDRFFGEYLQCQWRQSEEYHETEARMEKSISQKSPWQMKIIIGLRATRNRLSGRVLTMGDHSCIVKSTTTNREMKRH